MKKIVLITISTLFAIIGCEKEVPVDIETPKSQNTEYVTLTFRVTQGDEITDEDTKATFNRSGAFGWEVDDPVRFFLDATDSHGEDYYDGTVDAGLSSVSVTVPVGTAAFVSAVYPAGAGVAKNQVCFDQAAVTKAGPIVVADASQATLQFYHIGSLVNVKLNEVPAGTTKLVFSADVSKTFDGTFTFSEHVPSLSSTDVASTISASMPATDSGSQDGKDIVVTIPRVNLASGFTVCYQNASGRNLYKKTTANTFDLSTKRLLNMKELTYVAPSKLYFATSSTDGDWDVTDCIPIQVGANTYELNLNTSPTAKYYFYDEYNTDNKENGSLAKGTNSNAENNFGTWKIIGDAVASDWTYSNGAQLRYFGLANWSVLKNRSISANKYFKIASSDSYKFSAPDDYNDVVPEIGTEYSVWQKDNKAFKITTAGSYDIYYRFASESDAKIIVAPAAANFGDGAAIYTYTFNSSTNTATATPSWGILDKPFFDSNVLSKIRFIGYSAGWGSSSTEIAASSNQNDTYWIFDVTVSSGGTLEYKFKLNGDSYSDKYNWGLKDAQATNAGSNLYGSAVAQNSTGNNTISALTAGSYKLYVNAYSWYGNRKLNYMFIKQ